MRRFVTFSVAAPRRSFRFVIGGARSRGPRGFELRQSRETRQAGPENGEKGRSKVEAGARQVQRRLGTNIRTVTSAPFTVVAGGVGHRNC